MYSRSLGAVEYCLLEPIVCQLQVCRRGLNLADILKVETQALDQRPQGRVDRMGEVRKMT